MSSYLTSYLPSIFSPEKHPNPNLSSESDPLKLTPRPENTAKRALEITPPVTENKSVRLVHPPPSFPTLEATSIPASTVVTDTDAMEDLKETITGLVQGLNLNLSAKIEKMDAKLETLDEIKADIREGKEDREQMKEDLRDLRAEIDDMKAAPLPPNIQENVRKAIEAELAGEVMDAVRDKLTEEVTAQVKSELTPMYEAQFVHSVLDEVRRHDPGMVIFGYNWSNGISQEQFRFFCKTNLKYSTGAADSISLRSVTTLSRGKGTNPKVTVLVMFGSVGERDECLRQSFNLTKGIGMDKYMPKRYEEQYIKYKDTARKLRTAMSVSTFIGFQGYDLVLKQKQKNADGGRFGWVIYDKWTPKVTDQISSSQKVNSRSDTASASTSIDLNAMKRMVFISGFSSELDGPDTVNMVKTSLVGEEDYVLIEKIECPKKNSVVIYFHEDKVIPAFVKKYSNKEFLGARARLSQG